MKQITVEAPAKINLALDIEGVDQRGYHLMRMMMQAVSLCDTVLLEQAEEGIQLFCSDPSLPCDQGNIAFRCAQLFFEHTGILGGVKISIQKEIPQQAGLGGGSADGAAVLEGLNWLYDTGLSLEELCSIGVKVGADIPFCLLGGTARAEGIGEKLTPVASLPDCCIVIAKPKEGISTKEAFAAFDRQGLAPVLDLEEMERHLENQDLKGVCSGLYNVLERVCPLESVAQIEQMMLASGALGARMTGSGSAVFGIFEDFSLALACQKKLGLRFGESFLCRPRDWGCELFE